jgi:hypothetical protein
MGEAGSTNAPHGNINDKNDDDELDDGEEDPFCSCNVLATIHLSLSFMFNVVEP